MKTVAAICAYEEEANIEDCLESLAQIADLDAADILDGAWSHGGMHMQSQDKMEKLVDDLRLSKRMPFDIFFTRIEKPNKWKNESEKRNWQLNDIEHRWGSDTIVFVIDADEEVELNESLDAPYQMRPLLEGVDYSCGIVNAHSIDSSYLFPSLRLIPLGHGIHYHSNKAMCVHDANHNVIMDYEHGVKDDACTFVINRLQLLNKGIKRTPERLKEKTAYFAHRMITEGGRCRYQKPI